jgi:hypothetical protein
VDFGKLTGLSITGQKQVTKSCAGAAQMAAQAACPSYAEGDTHGDKLGTVSMQQAIPGRLNEFVRLFCYSASPDNHFSRFHSIFLTFDK